MYGLGVVKAPGTRLCVNTVTMEHAPESQYRRSDFHGLQLCVIPRRALIRPAGSTVTRLVCVRDGDVKDLSTQIHAGTRVRPGLLWR